MPVNSPPFEDVVPANSLVIPRGAYAWLKSQVTLNGTTVTPPDSGSFLVPGLVKVYDPDGVLITSTWATNALDPDDPEDVYDASHPTYRGSLASPPNIGLFHDGLGNLAFKIKVPTNAELTYLSSTRRHKVRWEGFLKNGGAILAIEETFVISEPGTITFGNMLVTPKMVRRGIVTRLTDEEIGDLCLEAGQWVRARLRDCRLTPADIEPVTDERILSGLVYWARLLVFTRDASAGFRVAKAQEGTKRVEFAGNSKGDRDDLERLAKEEMASFCREFGRGRDRISMGVVSRDLPGEGCC